MSQPAEVAFATARTLLNDDGVQLWTNVALSAKLKVAHRELQVQLRANACPITRASYPTTVAMNTTTCISPDDIVEPIVLWEKALGETDDKYVRMTEYDPLPVTAPSNRLIYWRWTDDAFEFIGSTTTRQIKIDYKRLLPIPEEGSDLIGIVDGESFLGPRIAALAFGSTGNTAAADWCTQMAIQSITDILVANRGRSRQVPRS